METNIFNSAPQLLSPQNPQTPQTPQTAEIEINGQTLRREDIWSVFNRGKFVLVFVAIIILKFIFDNVLVFAFLVASHLTLSRIKNNFAEQTSLKSRCKIKILLLITVISFVTFEYIAFVSAYFFEDDQFLLRRMLFNSKNIPNLGFMDILCRSAVTDLAVQILGEVIKLLVFIGFTAAISYFPSVCDSTQSFRYTDIERGFNFAPGNANRFSSQNGVEFIGSTIISSFLSSEAVRRRGDGSSANSAGSTSVAPPISTTTSDTSDADRGDGNIQLESSRYLLYKRIFCIIDLALLAYRTVLPCTLWLVYLHEGSVITSFALPIIYLACKIFDLSWKLSAVLEAAMFMVSGQMEYGHYATDQEVAAAAECPICFDQPVCPVALNCSESARCIYLSVESLSDHQQPHCALGHVFCECCIHEWIERERSCPVCRAEVSSASKYLGSVRSDISNHIPIVI